LLVLFLVSAIPSADLGMAESEGKTSRASSWAPHRSQRTRELLYGLRSSIRDARSRGKDRLKAVKAKLWPEGLQTLWDEILRSKAPEDGQNLLTYAAAQGRSTWFLHIAREIRSRLGVRALAKELREMDIEGAPLLFNAAACRGKMSCFKTAHDLIQSTLGKGGLIEQMTAVDSERRTILTYAARSKDGASFEEILLIFPRYITDHTPSKYLQTTMDLKRMTCAHHAAEAGCREVLEKVLKHGKETVLGEKDDRGRTPLMCVMQNTCGDDPAVVRAKLDLLLSKKTVTSPAETISETESMKSSHVEPPTAVETVTRVLEDVERIEIFSGLRARTELIHAMGGGLTSLELALNNFSTRTGGKGPSLVILDDALDVQIWTEPTVDPPSEGTWTAHPKRAAWGRALLLAAAAKMGDINLIRYVISTIQGRTFSKQGKAEYRLSEKGAYPFTLPERGPDDLVRPAVEALTGNGLSLLSCAVLSGRKEAVDFVYEDFILKLYNTDSDQDKKQICAIVTGPNSDTKGCIASPLGYAASASMEAPGRGEPVLNSVLDILKKTAEKDEEVKWRNDQLSATFSDEGRSHRITPLMGAVFSSNWVTFRRIFDERSGEHPWLHREIWPKDLPNLGGDVGKQHDFIPKPISRGEFAIPAVMWREIGEALRRGRSDRAKEALISWRDYLWEFSRESIRVAFHRGSLTDLRDLVQEGFPLHDEYIGQLLDSIGDHEEDVIAIVICAVANASNPFGMGAAVSRMLRQEGVDRPMHQKGLRRLQSIIDGFDQELLDRLPHTVQGMGKKLLGGRQPILDSRGLEEKNLERLGNRAGFVTAQWMLEPTLLVDRTLEHKRYDGPAYKDPLQNALDRGSEALDFVNSPLLLDYAHVKFVDTLPPWTSRNPCQPTLLQSPPTMDKPGNETEDRSVVQDASTVRDPPAGGNQPDREKSSVKEDFKSYILRRALQDTCGNLLERPPIRQYSVHEKRERETRTPPVSLLICRAPLPSRVYRVMQGWDHSPKQGITNGYLPHLTILPGLQFSLAGIIGKPETFYTVPVIRFAFEIFSYLIMLTLFCSSVLLKDPDDIPWDETIFYIFAAGLLWREVLEFRDGVPARRHPFSSKSSVQGKPPKEGPRDLQADGNFNRMVSALKRYVFFDTWNFLDTLTIMCILLAFVFRMITRFHDEMDIFHAQFFYALSAPLLFSRLLVLSQIDATLGPTTQVIWRMMSHTLRFSAFLAMVMLSFALAFHAVFHTCGTYVDPDACYLDGEDFPLRDAFGTFGSSFITVFDLALGGPDFQLFDDPGDDCRCNLPDGARGAGVVLMVAYMITMAVVLLNLLIAVLSTAHDEVYVNAEKEFHLARARLIVQSARSVAKQRPPPPINLAKVILGILVDTVTELWRLCLWVTDRSPPLALKPCSKTDRWKAVDELLQTLVFACTMGAGALALLIVLWLLSIPWIAWCLLRGVRHKA
ncbi:unnamed protein product, partial [Scytosiphon promiscuus]